MSPEKHTVTIEERLLISDLDRDAADLILEAAYDEFSISGIQSTSMETVARHAGVSRATLYRRFPTKASLLEAVAARSGKWAGKRIARAVKGLPPQETVVEAFSEAFRIFETVPFFQELLKYMHPNNSGRSTRPVTLYSAESATKEVADAIGGTLRHAGAKMPDDELTTAAEIQMRIILSLVQMPSPTIDTKSNRALSDFVRKYLAPMVY